MLTSIIVYLLLGASAGFLSGLIGIGGGLVVVPGLAILFHYHSEFQPASLMQMAIGTSLAAMVVTTSSSLRAHLKRGFEIKSICRSLIPGVILGTICGALVADWLNSHVLRMVFGAFVFIAALRIFFAKELQPKRELPKGAFMVIIGVLIGLISGMLGIGGSVMTIPFLTYCGVSLRRSVTVSVAVGIAVAIVGSISYILTGLNEPGLPPHAIGHVYWPAWLGLIVGSMILAPIGARLSHRLPVQLLVKIFSIFLFAVAAHMFWPH